MKNKRMVLEYTSNEQINQLYGPKMGHSLLTGQPVTTECTFIMTERGAAVYFRLPGNEEKGFRICPKSIIEQGEKLCFITNRSVYRFRLA